MQSSARRGLAALALPTATLALLLSVVGRASALQGGGPLTHGERVAWLADFLDRLDGPLIGARATAEALESRALASSSPEDLVLARTALARSALALDGPATAEDVLRAARSPSAEPHALTEAFLLSTEHAVLVARGQLVESYEKIERALALARDAGVPDLALRLELVEARIRGRVQERPVPTEELDRMRAVAEELGLDGLARWLAALALRDSEPDPAARVAGLIEIAVGAVDRGRPGSASRCNAFAARARLELGDVGGASDLAALALEQARDSGDRVEISKRLGLASDVELAARERSPAQP